MNRLILLPMARCPDCHGHLGIGGKHAPFCTWSYDEARQAIAQDLFIARDVTPEPKQVFDASKCRPSLGSRFCPRCMIRFANTVKLIEEFDEGTRLSCPNCNYRAYDR